MRSGRWYSCSTRLERFPGSIALTDVNGLGANEAVEALLLEAVRDPACHPSEGEGGREQFGREVEAVQQQGGIELHVRLQAPPRFVRFQQA